MRDSEAVAARGLAIPVDKNSSSLTEHLEKALQELEAISPKAIGLSEETDPEKGCLSCS